MGKKYVLEEVEEMYPGDDYSDNGYYKLFIIGHGIIWFTRRTSAVYAEQQLTEARQKVVRLFK